MFCRRRQNIGFQSTLPARGATSTVSTSVTRTKNFNPRSPHGERPMSDGKGRKKDQNFNPRSPHGERPDLCAGDGLLLHISIHAPRTGSDTCARVMDRIPAISIHAPRTGSDAQRLHRRVVGDISIHAPRTGSDAHRTLQTVEHSAFQSTLPARGATISGTPYKQTSDISIHAPRTGSDSRDHATLSSAMISIHAPRTGSDPVCDRVWALPDISIHAPRTGSDEKIAKKCGKGLVFQSTLPARGATAFSPLPHVAVPISIHAPRTGSDAKVAPASRVDLEFQSTLPARGATTPTLTRRRRTTYFNPRSPHGERPFRRRSFRRRGYISIHAPRTGSDSAECIMVKFPDGFQSTLPARGATNRKIKKSAIS